MTGGEICYNYNSNNGGGIQDFRQSTITISGGSIHDNVATGKGGGIAMNAASITLSGTAEITHNTASSCGGIYRGGDPGVGFISPSGSTAGGHVHDNTPNNVSSS
jgi:predicted outer membrane repeat protein